MRPVSLTMWRWLKKTNGTNYLPTGRLERGGLNGKMLMKKQERYVCICVDLVFIVLTNLT
jgi:hypothetical protein